MQLIYGIALGLIFGAVGVVYVEMTGAHHPEAPEPLPPPK